MIRVDGAVFAAAQAGDPIALDRLLRVDLTRALESLPEIYRQIVLLRDMEQLTIGEAADHLNITRDACKSRLHRARALLREYLRPEAPKGTAP